MKLEADGLYPYVHIVYAGSKNQDNLYVDSIFKSREAACKRSCELKDIMKMYGKDKDFVTKVYDKCIQE